MNYRHSYHAGNFADVVKHCVLIILLKALQRKDAAMCYLDTHAGIGLYDLKSVEASKTLEFQNGVMNIIEAKTTNPIIWEYQKIIKRQNRGKPLLFYPGSPMIAKTLLRPQDRMVLSELHPADSAELKQLFREDKQVAVHQQDAYLAMKAFLPPKENRGMVLIDPPYEEVTEWDDIVAALTRALHHWRMGTYVIWYPLKKDTDTEVMLKTIQSLAISSLLHIEIFRSPNDVDNRLNGCGMLIINPPWQVETELETTLQELKPLLGLHEVKLS